MCKALGLIASYSLLSCVALAESPADTLPTPPQGKAWKMVWHDEFDGDQLDPAKWETPPDGPRKAGWWMAKAVSLDGQGHLRICTTKEGDKYVMGCARTKGKFEHAFGYYVARVQLPKQQGHWSSFWIYSPGVAQVGSDGRLGTEIDIYEKFWPNDEVQHTLYWDSNGKAEKQRLQTVNIPGIREGWHTFALWWKNDEYVFYVDGKETWRINPGHVCEVPQYMKLSDETAEWCKDITKAKLPDEFLVDYVRVYDLVQAK